VKHLWEIKHPYYGCDGHESNVESFTELREAVDNSDEDMNVVYRWDWKDWSQPHYDGLFLDPHEREVEEFCVYMLLPRKSGFWSVTCPITKDQEPEVLEWLKSDRCAGYLCTLWEPVFTPAEEEAVSTDGQ
jgi:hypothetical protein